MHGHRRGCGRHERRLVISVVPATQDHIERALGGTLKHSAEAIALLREDGEVVGCAGIFPESSRLVIFSQLTEEARADKRAIIKGYRHLLRIADTRNLPLHARPDPDIEASERFLSHMGFRKLTGDCWERQPASGKKARS